MELRRSRRLACRGPGWAADLPGGARGGEEGTPEVAGWPEEVRSHLREHPRRPITRAAWLASPAAEAWRAVPVTILIGRGDAFIPAGQQELLRAQFSDVRITGGDHFLPLLRPGAVAEVIAEPLAATSSTPGTRGTGPR